MIPGIASTALFTLLPFLAGSGWLTDESRFAQSDSGIFKTSIQVTTNVIRHWIDPRGQRDEDTWSWTPRVKFNVQGPIAAGSQFSVEFLLAGGKPWLKYNCQTPEVEVGKIASLEAGYGIPNDQARAITSTGVFGFRVRLRNELTATDKVVFTGTFTVRKFHVGPDLPKTRNNFEYYVDHDWNLPIGFVWYPRPYRSADGVTYYDDYATLQAAFWFKAGPVWEKDVAAYLLYQGREISSTKSHGHMLTEISNSTGEASSPYEYSRVRFEFMDVFAFVKNAEAHPGFYLDKNPGEYEVRVLRNGHLARVLKFNVGTNGKILDNGIAQANGILGPRMVVPVQVVGDTDGLWNKDAWRIEALYGNPLKGFVAP